jgi:hypothetical protein
MAKIARAHQKVFCDGVAAQDNIAQFGSLKASPVQYSKDPATIQALQAFDEGWKSAVVSNNAPPLQDENALFYLLTRQIAYLMQQGIAEWHASTEYHSSSYCQSGGVVYRSIVNDNTGNAVTNTNYWRVALEPNTNGGAMGNVPLGAIVAIGNAQAWTTPAGGEVKDGYALCNGQNFSSLPGGSYASGFSGALPSLVNRFLYGSTVAGATGGAATIFLSAAQIPRLWYSALSVTGTVNIAHSHSEYSGTTNRALTSGATPAGGGGHGHTVTGETNVASNDTGGGGVVSGTTDSRQDFSYFGASFGTSTPGEHTHSVSGNTDISHTHTLGTTNVALANGITAFLSIGQESPSGVSILPPYMNVVYVMRVK